MQKEMTITELENTINTVDDIENPIIIKRNNKKDLVIISLEQYQKVMFIKELEKSKREYEEGNVHNAEIVFKDMNIFQIIC